MPRDDGFTTEDVTLPDGEIVPVSSLCRFIQKRLANCGPLMHLQRIRRGDTSLEAAYRSEEAKYVNLLARNTVCTFTHIISPPSRFPFAARYRERFQTLIPRAIDLTLSITRRSRASFASDPATTFEDIINGLIVEVDSSRTNAISLLIVDDVFQSGKTVGAVLGGLRRAGVVTKSVAVACPLRIVV